MNKSVLSHLHSHLHSHLPGHLLGRLLGHLNQGLKIALLLTASRAFADPAPLSVTATATPEQEKNQTIPMLAQVPTFDEQTATAKLLANAVNKQEALNNQRNVMTVRQLEAQNKHTGQILEQEKLALERNKLALEQFRLTQQQQALEQQALRSKKGSKKGSKKRSEKTASARQKLGQKPQQQYQEVANIRLASIIALPSGALKAIFYQGNNRFAYLQGDQMFMGAELLKVAANGVAIKLNQEVIFKYLN